MQTRRALTDRGYAYATVTRSVYLDVVHRVAETKLDVVPGEPATSGAITFTGLEAVGSKRQEVPTRPLLRTVDIAPGEPFSTARIASATEALLDLGVLALVDIVPDRTPRRTSRR